VVLHLEIYNLEYTFKPLHKEHEGYLKKFVIKKYNFFYLKMLFILYKMQANTN
jgi:hypothetical protein